MHLVLYQPDIAQNTGTILRLAACMGCKVDIIEPCGFPFDDRRFRRAGMDYLDQLLITRHRSWEAFCDNKPPASRLLLLTTKSTHTYTDFTYRDSDMLLLGQESTGVPHAVHDAADARLTIPMHGSSRSLNVALAAAMVTGEAKRQLHVPMQNVNA